MGAKSLVLKIYDLNKTILSFQNKLIDNPNDILEKIKNLNIKDRKVRKEHIKNINNQKIINFNRFGAGEKI